MVFRIIGDGRAGGSFHIALTGAGWHSAGMLGRADSLNQAGQDVDVVILAVPDDQIESVASSITPSDAAVVHLSGAKTLSVLTGHIHRASVHPLVSLPNSRVGAALLSSGISFAVAGDPRAEAIVDALSGEAFAVDDTNRSLYHCGATVAANHLTVIAAQVERIAELAGVPADVYWGLMRSTVDNIATLGPVDALTGPAVRGDDKTIAEHLIALPVSERKIYESLSYEAARLGQLGHNRQPPLPRQ